MQVALLASVGALGVAGCVEPDSPVTRTWCVDPEPQSFVVVDDMEDGDGSSCAAGRWSVRGGGALDPTPGPLGGTVDLEGRAPSLRALHLGGTTEAGGYASLFLALAPTDLTPFQEIQFWARSETGVISVRVNVATVATTDAAEGGGCDSAAGACGDHFGDNAQIADAWGDRGNPNSIALAALTQTGVGQAAPKDLSQTVGLEFRVAGVGMAATNFGLWVDDIRLKKPPGS